MSLAPYVHAMGRGPGRARHLTREEAADAMAQILSGQAAPEATGALLMLMRYRGETAEEIAGFVDGLRVEAGQWRGAAPDLDWPSYAAGRTRGLPWFLLAAKLVAEQGFAVLLHGWNSHQARQADVRAALPSAGIKEANSLDEASDLLAQDRIAYLPLEAASKPALALVRLRDVLGLRSPVNTALRLLNPGGAACSVQGVFHPPYRGLQTDASALLGQQMQMVLKGAGGEFERSPAKDIALMGLADGKPFEITAPRSIPESIRLADGPERSDHQALEALWSGHWSDGFAQALVTGTAAAAFLALGATKTLRDGEAMAAKAWEARRLYQAA